MFDKTAATLVTAGTTLFFGVVVPVANSGQEEPTSTAAHRPVTVQQDKRPSGHQSKRPAVRSKRSAVSKRRDTPNPEAKDAVRLLRSQVGTQERGDNRQKYGKWYGLNGVAWCDQFVSWIGSRLGMRSSFGRDKWTVSHARWFQKQKRWGKHPRTGAVVFFTGSGKKSITAISHVGVVTNKNGPGKTVRTVEGNKDDQVSEQLRNPGEIVGYGYPDYSS